MGRVPSDPSAVGMGSVLQYSNVPVENNLHGTWAKMYHNNLTHRTIPSPQAQATYFGDRDSEKAPETCMVRDVKSSLIGSYFQVEPFLQGAIMIEQA